VHVEVDQLAAPQAGAVEQGQHGGVAPAGGAGIGGAGTEQFPELFVL
jgi:hypothetical protein